MWKVRVRARMLALSLLLAAVEARAQCTKDLDCAGEQICDDGKCAEPAATPTTPALPAAAPAALPAAPAPGRPRVVGRPRVLTVESPPVPESPHFERRSVPLVVAGTFAVAAGLIGLGVGVLSSGSTCYRELDDDFKVEHCERSPNYAAYAVGGLLFAAGIPMIVLGGHKVRVEPEARLSSWLSPRGGGLRLSFEL